MFQKLNLFHDFIGRWQTIMGGQALVISTTGEIVATSNGSPSLNWPEVIAQISPNQPSVIELANQILLTAPFNLGKEPLGYLLAFNVPQEDISLLGWLAETIGARLGDEIALAGMTDELIGAWDQLELIYRVTRNLSLSADLTTVLRSIVQEIRKVVDTEDGFILLKRSKDLECVTSLGRPANLIYDDRLLAYLVSSQQVLLCNDRADCQKIWPALPSHLENILATPLPIVDEETKAILGLINKAGGDFSAGDVKLLAVLAQQVGTIIKNFLVHERLIYEERLSRELEIAAEIQESLLPTTLPQVGGLSIAVSSEPASEVGGDFYDFITIDDRNLTLIMGDVAGKGIPAAMLTSVTRTMLRVEAMRGEAPQKIIERANRILHQDLGRADSFVTVFAASIDTVEGKLNYASAGHTPALLWRAESRTTEQLRSTSPPIGIVGYEERAARTLQLKPGDTLVLYTDGITEAQSPRGDFFGLNRLIYILESRFSESPENLQQYVQREVANFRSTASGRDDATLLIVKMLPQSEAVTPPDISTVVKTVDFSYPAEIHYLTDIAKQVKLVCRELPGLNNSFDTEDFIYLVELAISEICTNIIKHAYADRTGNLDGRITVLNNGIQLDFYDTGISFDPNTVPQPSADPDQLSEGGFGLHIVRQVMDVVSYEHHPKRGNHWYLLKLLPRT
jgi:serine phosphatase RsbU (regulator of sigma subunit)/anti-sigma regulatory factor (Ser/Thr protein kinase)